MILIRFDIYLEYWFNISSIAGRAVNTTISLLFLFKDCDVMNDWTGCTISYIESVSESSAVSK